MTSSSLSKKSGYNPDSVLLDGASTALPEISLISVPTDFESETDTVDGTEAARRTVFLPPIITTLPLGGIRTFDALALLAPRVLPPPATNGIPGPGISASVGKAGQFTVNGLRSR